MTCDLSQAWPSIGAEMNMALKKRVIVLNASFPHLDTCAIELARHSLLDQYIHAFLLRSDTIGTFERRLPGIARNVVQRLRVREMPPSLATEQVYCPAMGLELLRSVLSYASQRLGYSIRSIDRAIIQKRNDVISGAIMDRIRDDSVVLSCYTAAYRAFRMANKRGALSILDYPTAHHAYLSEVRERETARWPDWADTWPPPTDQKTKRILDEECSRADRIVVGSNFAANTFPCELRKKVIVCPYGLSRFEPRSISPLEPASRTSTLELLFVGQLTLRKGLPYLINAMRSLPIDRVRCRLIGPQIGRGRWRANLPPNVEVVGPVPRTRLAEHYSTASALVLPSVAEGLPNVILEALASGVPVITTPTGGDDIVTDGRTGLIVPACDSAALSQAIASLLDQEVRNRFRENVESDAPTSRSRMTSIVDVVTFRGEAGR